MKIRWSRGSVRLRITPSELEALQRGESVVEELVLPGGRWRALLCAGAATAIRIEGNELWISLSDSDRTALSAPDAEGVYFLQEDDSARPVRYYVEKDFPCVHPRAAEAAEPATETFKPPAGFEERKLASS